MTRRSPESSSKKGKPLPPKPSKESEFKKPVAWLLGRQLIASLKGVVLLAIYGGKLDPRDWMRANVFSVRGRDGHEIVESQEAPSEPASGEFWFDYISDSGDGQLATYSIAYLCLSDLWAKRPASGSPPKITFKYEDEPMEDRAASPSQDAAGVPVKDSESPFPKNEYRMPRGSFLLIGGDTAYHMADYQTLARRFWNSFRWAAGDHGLTPKSERRPLFGIPGNHDYYDAIDGFNRQFRLPTSQEDTENLEGKKPQLSIPGFERRQTGSYLAVRMPFDWWLWAVDSEIGGVDIRQQEFFKKLAQQYDIKKLVVATSEPTTVLGQQSTADNRKTARVFDRLKLPPSFLAGAGQTPSHKRLHPGTCRVDLSGDTHHYARYYGPTDQNSTADYISVVAGIGGAFMHPTQTDMGEIEAVVKYPEPKVSREAVTRELLRPSNLLTGGFIWLIGVVIAGLITFAALRVPSSRAAADSFLLSLPGVTSDRLAQPSGIIHITDGLDLSGSWASNEDQQTSSAGLKHSFLLWWAIVGAGALILFAATWPKRIFKRAKDEEIDSTDYWPVWLLAIAAIAIVAFGLGSWGRDHSAARVLSDLVFITLVIVVPGGAVFAAASSGAELLGTTGKVLFGVLGLWHGAIQVALPFLLIRLGGGYSIGIAALVLTLAAALGILGSRLFPEIARGMDWRFGLALLSLWVIAVVLIVAAILYVPGPALMNLGTAAGGWVLGPAVAAAALIGALLSCVNLGWYLAVAVSFNGHNNEAGGAARIGEFKQMVRFRITKDELTGFVIGFDRPRMNGADLDLKLIDVFRIRP